MFALQRVLAAVNTAVAAAIGTHNLFTLLDLERLVLSMRANLNYQLPADCSNVQMPCAVLAVS